MARWILKQAGDISRLCYVTTGLVVCSWLALGLQSQALRLGWNLQPTKPGIDHEKIRLLEIKKKPASKGTNKYPWTPIAYIWLIMFRMFFLHFLGGFNDGEDVRRLTFETTYNWWSIHGAHGGHQWWCGILGVFLWQFLKSDFLSYSIWIDFGLSKWWITAQTARSNKLFCTGDGSPILDHLACSWLARFQSSTVGVASPTCSGT